MPGERARSALAGSRFAELRWLDETGSTNADMLEAARQGAPEGSVIVAEHQSAGRGRAGRAWVAPRGASLLASVLLRPPAAAAPLVTAAVALAAAEAVEACTGIHARLKWPNDLVVPGDGSGADRKLAGVLAEADWPAETDPSSGWRPPGSSARVAVVVGVGVNVDWPDELPEDLADVAVACNHLGAPDVDREALLVAWLTRLERHYAGLLAGRSGTVALLGAWRARSATLGRAVRVELGAYDVVGTAVDLTDSGQLVVEDGDGNRRVLAVGDVVHLRPG